MIKTFEQFVSTMYGRPVNEAFQSGKLREIIKQHGEPNFSWDKDMLYDLKAPECPALKTAASYTVPAIWMRSGENTAP